MKERDSRKFMLADAVAIPFKARKKSTPSEAGKQSIPSETGRKSTVTLEKQGTGDDAQFYVLSEVELSDKMSVVRTFHMHDVRGVYDTSKDKWVEEKGFCKDGDEVEGIVYVREEAPTLMEIKIAMKAGESLEHYNSCLIDNSGFIDWGPPGDPHNPENCPGVINPNPPVPPPGDPHNPENCPQTVNPNPPVPPPGG